MSRARVWIMLAVSLAFVAGSVTEAVAGWRPFSIPTQKISTLVVTGNYAKTRLMAELIQIENKQPILLLPAEGQERIYFIPPKNRMGGVLSVPYSDLDQFIRFLGPKQVLILGDERYVSDAFREKIPPRVTVWIVHNDNWYQAADSIGKLMNLTNLASDYRRLLSELLRDERYWRKSSNGDPSSIIPSADAPVPAMATPDGGVAPADTAIEIEEVEVVEETPSTGQQ